jgi:hypothetical protein
VYHGCDGGGEVEAGLDEGGLLKEGRTAEMLQFYESGSPSRRTFNSERFPG